MVPLSWSYYRAVTAPGSAPLSVKSVEWFKGLPGGTWVTLKTERLWYSWHKPPVGGSLVGGIPAESPATTQTPSPAAGVPALRHLPTPANIKPFVSNPLPNEGVWQPVGRTVKGVPTTRVAFLRPDGQHTSLLGTVMWMDQTLLSTRLIPGTQVPGGASTPAEIPKAQFDSLVATFNSGFLLKDSHGGFYVNGHTYAPLVNGQASMVIYKDGTVDIGRWENEVTMTPQVAAVRQNLAPLVDNGRPVAGLAQDSFLKWGATLGNTVLVWRSGVGITADGAIVYAAAPALSVRSLASLLARAGAVRGMELDINPEWTTGIYYTAAPNSSIGIYPHLLLATMQRSSQRYLIPDERDFFAEFIRPKLLNGA
ncbi:MAG: phosphodiester glycosidase family protein [Actinomycetota bacterium]